MKVYIQEIENNRLIMNKFLAGLKITGLYPRFKKISNEVNEQVSSLQYQWYVLNRDYDIEILVKLKRKGDTYEEIEN